MHKINDLFQKDVHRKIEEVIVVDQADEETVKNEIKEYVITDTIKDHYLHVLDEYNRGRTNPSEGIGIWISGFFGSGKSSFAKILGYVLSAKSVIGQNATDLFIERIQDERASSLLKVINTTIPTHAIIFDISMDRGVRTANEKITEVMYKALLRELGYAEDFDLAELEITLEERGELEEFVQLYEKTYTKFPWSKAKKRAGRAISEASRILHDMDSKTYPSADSWANSLGEKGRADITANGLAERSFELMSRRKAGYSFIFVIDEVGQYISRSVDKMLDLQGVVQAFGKVGKNYVKEKKAISPAWIVVTSQEKLDEIVSSLDSKKIEMARLKDRFPITVDLAPADIAEIAVKRVLQKTPIAEAELSDLFNAIEGKLNTNCKLERTSIKSEVTKQDFINFYPYLPHYIDLSIDIVSGIRLQPGAQRHIGGSNRTIIKQAQQMLVHDKTKLGEQEIGKIVSMDKVYDLVENNLSQEKRQDISDISKDFSEHPFIIKVAKTICILEFTKKLPRTSKNIAALLYDNLNGSSVLSDVETAVKELENANYVKSTDEGYKLQTLQEKGWDIERKKFDAKPADRNKIRRELIDDIFDHNVRNYRYGSKTFKLGLKIDETAVGQEGDIPIRVIVAEDLNDFDNKKKQSREDSRDTKNENDIFLVFNLNVEIHNLIEELHRSNEMIGLYDRLAANGKIRPEEAACLADEKRKKESMQRDVKSKFKQAISVGVIYFKGFETDNSGLGTNLADILKKFLDRHVKSLYPKLEMGSVKLKGDEAEKILTAVNLAGLPPVFYDGPDGLGLVMKEDGKYITKNSAPTADEVLHYLSSKHSYGEKITGKDIENKFIGIGYGWDIDLLKVVLASLFRGGIIEVTSQGRRFTSYRDAESRKAFVTNPAFRAASFTPSKPIDIKVLADAARNYEEITGEEVDVEKEAIAYAFKQLAITEKENLRDIYAKIKAHSLPVQDFVTEYMEKLNGIEKSEPEDRIKLLADEGVSFKADKEKMKKISMAITDLTLELLNKANSTLTQKCPILSERIKDQKLEDTETQLNDAVSAESFYERLSDISSMIDQISFKYEELYIGTHKKRDEVYLQIIKEIKEDSDWAKISEEQQDLVLDIITKKMCEKDEAASKLDVDFNSHHVLCSKCNASIGQIESDIDAAPSLKKKALDKIVEATSPSQKFERIKISTFFGNSVTSVTELELGIRSLKEHIEKLLAEGKKVILE